MKLGKVNGLDWQSKSTSLVKKQQLGVAIGDRTMEILVVTNVLVD